MALLNHPAFDRRVKAKMLLKVTRMSRAQAQATIQALTDTRAIFDQPDQVGEYQMVAEVFHINQKAA